MLPPSARSSAARPASILRAALALLITATGAHAAFTTFESGQVRPLALSPDGTRLFAVNTPDDRLEIFAVVGGRRSRTPARCRSASSRSRSRRASNTEVWVVNHLSDSVSIVDVGAVAAARRAHAARRRRAARHRVRRPGRQPRLHHHRAPRPEPPRRPAAHHAGRRPRRRVGVRRRRTSAPTLGGTPLTDRDALRRHAARARRRAPTATRSTPPSSTPATRRPTLIGGRRVRRRRGGRRRAPSSGATMPGGLPAPNTNVQGTPQPEVGLIVKFDDATNHWEDELGRNWDNAVRFTLPDHDVFAIDANAGTPAQTASFARVGTILFNMVVNPVSGKVYVTQHRGAQRGPLRGARHVRRAHRARPPARGAHHRARRRERAAAPPEQAHRLRRRPEPGRRQGEEPRDADRHGGDERRRRRSTSPPSARAQVGVFDTAQLEDDTFAPSAPNHIAVSGGGPSGLVLDEARGRLYVLTRFDNAICGDRHDDGDARSRTCRCYNPEPASVVNGRPFLYDAVLHVEQRRGVVRELPHLRRLRQPRLGPRQPRRRGPEQPEPDPPRPVGDPDFHPMKGPMTTQSLRGMANHGPMHWRGDRTGGNDPGGDPLDGGRRRSRSSSSRSTGCSAAARPISDADMQAFTDFILQVTYPPNPIRALDNSARRRGAAGRTHSSTSARSPTPSPDCNGCHVLDPANGLLRHGRRHRRFEGETQVFKIPHLRNLYQKVGMFGMPAVPFIERRRQRQPGRPGARLRLPARRQRRHDLPLPPRDRVQHHATPTRRTSSSSCSPSTRTWRRSSASRSRSPARTRAVVGPAHRPADRARGGRTSATWS